MHVALHARRSPVRVAVAGCLAGGGAGSHDALAAVDPDRAVALDRPGGRIAGGAR